jgi:predicted AAA+ superfamily ATPase
MTVSNADRVGKSITLLREGLMPFVQREMQAVYGKQWADKAAQTLEQRALVRGANISNAQGGNIDFQAMVTLFLSHWEDVFRRNLGNFERNLIHEMNQTRNRWAHQEPFSTDDTYRALDTAGRLLAAAGAANEAAEIERDKQELMRTRYEEQARREKQRTTTVAVEGQPAAGLRPWRDVITPHRDVASGKYQVAEFAADLGQVHRGEAGDEYQLPLEFFRRTFLTEGLQGLLLNGLQRLSGKGGEPVMDLQTNFGGGKTHSMLALYHLASGEPPGNMPGIEPLLQKVGLDGAVKANRVVLVGTALGAAQPRVKADGTVVNTLWGEMAWQLGGAEGYAMVRANDESGVSPGSDALRELFTRYSPCLVLIDEWVAYARSIFGNDGLPGGSFDANTLDFAQHLSEAAKSVPRAFVVVSIPASNIEVGGDGGQTALQHLKNTIIRIASPWRPASAEEGFEIVRRRLFEPITAQADHAARDAAAKAFATMYRTQVADFPDRSRDGSYEQRLSSAYPIHPELFDQLYGEWSTLDRFQRTRGVLRLMAAVVHTLWERNDASPIILPASLPLDDATVQSRLTGFLEDPWVPVIERDIDGTNSLPIELDRANPTLGRYSACRRVARTIFLGSAPTLRTSHRGIGDRDVKLGCVQPGESAATFGDALRKLTDEATHLYVDQSRYWFDTQPSVARTARDRAAALEPLDVMQEIIRRLRKDNESRNNRGEFSRVHACPVTHADVPDDPETCLVILPPDLAHSSNVDDSDARRAAADYLDHRGSGSRTNRNAIVFLATDRARMTTLEQSVRQYLAWKEIEEQKATLNLDAFQAKQAESKRASANEAVTHQIADAYAWLLVPSQALRAEGPPKVDWQQIRLQGSDPLAVRASKRLITDELMLTGMGGSRLRMELDRVPLWKPEGHVSLRELWEHFARYLYLPRLKDGEVLNAAIRDGVGKMLWETEGFGIAEGWDEANKRYVGLRAGHVGGQYIDGSTLAVKPDIARAQLDATAVPAAPVEDQATRKQLQFREQAPVGSAAPQRAPITPRRRFYGSVKLNELKVSSGAGQVGDEVIKHLTALLNADVEVTLEIRATVRDGIPDNVIRTVSENANTLKFETFEFEE